MQLRTLLACAGMMLLGPACARPQPQPAAAPAASASPGATPPRLVILAVVDQLPSWWFQTQHTSPSGGIARLMREAAYYREGVYPYAVTFTAAGHAALGTGAPPAVTGVSDNEKYAPKPSGGSAVPPTGTSGNCEEGPDPKQATDRSEVPTASDPDAPVFLLVENSTRDPRNLSLVPTTPGTARSDEGRSSKALLVDGVADVLRREKTGARAVTISIKDRSAIFVAGKRPHLAIWFDDRQPAMTTSKFYAATPPAWLTSLAAGDFVTRRIQRDAPWQDPEGKSARSHALDEAKELIPSPAGDALVFDTALRAIDEEKLGQRGETDFLALSFSSHDYAGHYYGPDSWERVEIFQRFDERLAGFLKELDTRFGPRGYALVLTSDHGVTPLVETSQLAGYQARRVHRCDVRKQAEKAATRVLGPGNWILHVSDNAVYTTPAFASHAQRESALDAVVTAVRDMPGIQYAAAISRLRGGCDTRSGMEALVCRSLVPENPGDVYFAAAPKSITTRYAAGTNHGSPNLEDRVVPILVYAPGDPRWSAQREVRDQVSTLQVAPTLAALLGISAPPAAREEPLP